MAMQHFLAVYPMPENPSIYTGFFQKRWEDRAWSNKPNKCISGVSYTKYIEMENFPVGEDGLTMFDFLHGKCGYFSDYLHIKNPKWQVIDMMRGTFWNPMIHSYCVRTIGGKTYFADARGITDDPEEFFSDFTCGKTMYISERKAPDECLAYKWECGQIFDFIKKSMKETDIDRIL